MNSNYRLVILRQKEDKVIYVRGNPPETRRIHVLQVASGTKRNFIGSFEDRVNLFSQYGKNLRVTVNVMNEPAESNGCSRYTSEDQGSSIGEDVFEVRFFISTGKKI